MDISTTYPKPHPQTSGRVIDGEAILILADASEINVLNSVGSVLYEHSTGANSIADIIDIIVESFDVPYEQAKADTVAFFIEMAAQNVLLLTPSNV